MSAVLSIPFVPAILLLLKHSSLSFFGADPYLGVDKTGVDAEIQQGRSNTINWVTRRNMFVLRPGRPVPGDRKIIIFFVLCIYMRILEGIIDLIATACSTPHL